MEDVLKYTKLKRIEEKCTYGVCYYEIESTEWSEMFGLDLRCNTILKEEVQDDSNVFYYCLGYFVEQRFVSVIRWQSYCPGDDGFIKTDYS